MFFLEKSLVSSLQSLAKMSSPQLLLLLFVFVAVVVVGGGGDGLPLPCLAEQVLQVFVQQTLTTSYQTSTCTFNDICECCHPD